MIHLLISFVFNVFIVLIIFLFILLVFLWAIGKQKEARERHFNSNPACTYPQGHQGTATVPQHDDSHQQQPFNAFPSSTAQYENMNVPVHQVSSPAVMPRRLSFSSSTTPTNQYQPPLRQHQFHQNQNIPTNAPKTPIMSVTPSRRVTFSLTPEQQQNEYDKQASANLARRKAPALVSRQHRFQPTARDIPLVELFPAEDSAGNAPSDPSNIPEDRQGFQPEQYTHKRLRGSAPTPMPQPHISSALPQSFYSQNPFMPTDPEDFRGQDAGMNRDQNVRRRRPPPLSVPM